MRFVAFIVGVIVFVALSITLIGKYLGPDDIAGCTDGPSGNPCATADAIVAVSGGDTTARTHEAIDLYKAGWAPRLIFSGAALDPNSPSNADAMRRQAIEAGVPSEAIDVDESARDTFENARGTSELTIGSDAKRIILVTSAYHQRRASIEFRQALAGIEIINHPVASDSQWAGSWWWTTPRGWWLAGGELTKIAVVTFRGTYSETTP